MSVAILLLLIAGFNSFNSTVEKEIFIIQCLVFFVFLQINAFFGYSGKRGRRDAGGFLQRETNLQTLITLIQLSSANIHSRLHTYLILFL